MWRLSDQLLYITVWKTQLHLPPIFVQNGYLLYFIFFVIFHNKLETFSAKRA